MCVVCVLSMSMYKFHVRKKYFVFFVVFFGANIKRIILRVENSSKRLSEKHLISSVIMKRSIHQNYLSIDRERGASKQAEPTADQRKPE